MSQLLSICKQVELTRASNTICLFWYLCFSTNFFLFFILFRSSLFDFFILFSTGKLLYTSTSTVARFCLLLLLIRVIFCFFFFFFPLNFIVVQCSLCMKRRAFLSTLIIGNFTQLVLLSKYDVLLMYKFHSFVSFILFFLLLISFISYNFQLAAVFRSCICIYLFIYYY